jgi:hypothetical protein
MAFGTGLRWRYGLYSMATTASVILERDLQTSLCPVATYRWQITNPGRRLVSSLTRPFWGAVLLGTS